MLIGTLSTTLSKILCEIMVDFQVIVQNNKDPDDN